MLIEIEGPSGAGKTSLINGLSADGGPVAQGVIDIARQERQKPHELAWTLGSFMRGLDVPAEPVEAAFLYSARTAARARLITQLRSDAIVVADRFRLSLCVTARRAGLADYAAQTLVSVATRGVVPDCTVLLDLDYDTHCRRLTGRGHPPLAQSEFELSRTHFRDAYSSASAPKLLLDTSRLSPRDVQVAVLGQLTVSGGTLCGDSF